jgi:hypothetical protein
MSISFRLSKKVLAVDLFDGRLQKFGVREHIHPSETDESKRCLTDGRNYLCVSVNDGIVDTLTRYAPNGFPLEILYAIDETFDTDILTEDNPRFWGFDTEEEWREAEAQMCRDYEERFRAELLKYLLGEPNKFVTGIIAIAEAKGKSIAAATAKQRQTSKPNPCGLSS